MTSGTGTVRLDVVSDTICPWCYVGKRRLAAAMPLLAAEGLTFEVMWRPFQLNPTIPKEGLDRRTYRSAKFGSWEKSQALDAQAAAAGATAGLVFRHDPHGHDTEHARLARSDPPRARCGRGSPARQGRGSPVRRLLQPRPGGRRPHGAGRPRGRGRHRPRTHAGAAAKAARDATVLAAALRRAQGNVDAGLGSFEEMQLECGRDMTCHGIQLGQRWAAKAR